MYLLGYSLNNLSLMALTISAGFVVDDAIVMIENITRYIEEGETPYDAAMKGAGEIGFTIVSLTVSLIAVLIPLLFMQEVVGRLFREFAVTLAVTILISAVVSLTLVPMLCAKLLRSHAEDEKRESGIQRRIEGYYERLVAEYDRLLIWVLKHQPLTLMVAVGTLVLTVADVYRHPQGLLSRCRTPASSRPSPRPAPPCRFDAMAERQQQLAAKILQGPGCRQPVLLHRRGRHQQHAQQRPLPDQPQAQEPSATASPTVMDRLAADAHSVPGITFYLQPVQDLTIDSVVSRAQYQFVLQAATSSRAQRVRAQAAGRSCSKAKAMRNVSTRFSTRACRPIWTVDRDTAARFGVTAATIDNALYDSFGQRIISTIFTQSNQYRVILEADPKPAEFGGSRCNDIYLPTAGGGQVPLSAIAQVDQRTVPLQIDHLSPVPLGHLLLRRGAGLFAGRGGGRDPGRPRPMPARRPASPPSSKARRSPSSRPCPTKCC